LMVGVASERLGRPRRQSRHGLLWSASQASALDGPAGKAGTASYGRRRKRAPWTAPPAKPARPLMVGAASERLRRPHRQSRHGLLWSAPQASALDGRTGKAGTASMVGVASERLRRPHRQSRHGLYGRRRKRAPLESRERGEALEAEASLLR